METPTYENTVTVAEQIYDMRKTQLNRRTELAKLNAKLSSIKLQLEVDAKADATLSNETSRKAWVASEMKDPDKPYSVVQEQAHALQQAMDKEEIRLELQRNLFKANIAFASS